MISRISIKGFKRIDSADIELGDVTLLYGPNSEGKSSIMQAIELVLSSIFHSKGRDIRIYASRNTQKMDVRAELCEPLPETLLIRAYFSILPKITPLLKNISFEIPDFKHEYGEEIGVKTEPPTSLAMPPPPVGDICLLDPSYLSSLLSKLELSEKYKKLGEISRVYGW